MVDAVHAIERRAPPAADGQARPLREGAVRVLPATDEALAAYARFLRKAQHAPPQGELWVRQWARHANSDLVLAFLDRQDEIVAALALEVVPRGPFRVARFPAGSHANGNFPAILVQDASALQADVLQDFLRAIGRQRPDIDVIALERLLPDLDGGGNPFLAALPSHPSPNVALAVALDGGFSETIGRHSGKRKRKKYRSQSRKFDIAGGYRHIEARSAAEVERLLEAFFAMKEVRFRKAGIGNVFADEGVQRFLRGLFLEALQAKPPAFVLHALEVGGTLRAVTGSSLRGKTLICEFGAILEDELAQVSPGDFLFFENIREACERGFAVYDFSVGDEHYKRLWCDIETRHRDVVLPLTAKGRLLASGLRGAARLKAFVKSNALAWRLVKAFRRRSAGQGAPKPDADED